MENTLDFTLTEEQQMIRDSVRDFAQSEIAPIAAAHDITGEFPMDTIKQAGALGLMGIQVPEEYGGSGLDSTCFALAIEEVAAVDASHSVIMSVHNSLYCNGIIEFGTHEQKLKYVKPVASGQELAAYALTEPQSGSDAANMRSKAVLSADGSYYTINAKKSWITSGPVARFIVLFAMTDPDKGNKGATAFIIDTEKEGFARGKTEPKLGIRSSATCEIELTDYKCDAADVIGKPGEGFKIAMTILDAGRVGIAAQALGIARAAYDAALQYSRDRIAFGKPIGTFQMTQAKLADMKMRLEASRLLTMQAAWGKDEAKRTGGRNSLNGSMAKLYASEAAMFITHASVQIHGGMGYSKEMPIERYFRDAKITEIYEGTSEIQRMLIGRLETGLR